MKFEIEKAVEVLSRTPATLNALLNGLDESWTSVNEGPDTWSVFDVIGHLIHGEKTDWIPRARIILEHGESEPFEPFNMTAHFDASKGKTVACMLEEFTALRARNMATLKSFDLDDEKLQKRGTHPEFGVVTLRQHLSTWVAHDLAHIAQIARVMSRQYKEEVGPWRQYLSLLKD